MTTKIWIAVMTALSALYLGLMLQRGIVLISDPNLLVKILGLALLLLPMFAFWAIAREIGFGLSSERLARKISSRALINSALNSDLRGELPKKVLRERLSK